MSNNTNTLFWVITGAVIVLSIFLLVLNTNSDTITNIASKVSSLFSEKLTESEKEELNNPSNLEKYYSYQGSWDSIKIEDTSLFNFDEETGTILAYNGTSANIIIPYQINGVIVKKIGPLGRELNSRSFNYENCLSFLEQEKNNPDDPSIISDREYYEEQGILKDNVCLPYVELKSVVLPNTIEELGDDSFYYTEALTSIKLPSSIKKIGNRAFFCSGLRSLDLSNLKELTYIGEYAFNNSSITGDVIMPDSLTYLGQYSFGGNNIINAVIPKNLDVVQARTFFANPNLATLTFRGSQTNVSSLYMFHNNAKPTVYVPIGSKDWYKRFQCLSNFTIVEIEI